MFPCFELTCLSIPDGEQGHSSPHRLPVASWLDVDLPALPHGKPDVTSSSRSALALEPQRVREHARVFMGASLATPLKTGDILGFVTAAFVQLLWSPADVRRHPFAPAIRPFSPRRSHGVCTDDLAARFRAIGIAPCRDPSINRVQNQQQPSVDERSLPNPCFKDNCRQIVKELSVCTKTMIAPFAASKGA